MNSVTGSLCTDLFNVISIRIVGNGPPISRFKKNLSQVQQDLLNCLQNTPS